MPYFRPATIEDLQLVWRLEEASYPPDEAATLDKLKFRIKNAGNLFMVACSPASSPQDDDEVLGFICGTQAQGSKLTHDSMSSHDPDGMTLCIHSVVVEETRRRHGLALRMIKAYMGYVQATTPDLEEVRLLCKADLVELYSKAGFEMIGPSDVVHGQELWYEMCLSFDSE